jgi:multiple sugar transport system ATP-binding protein
MAGVRVSNLVKRYGSTQALRNVSLEIEDGEFVVLLGPSGCGKTTMLRCIAGLEFPEEGDIFIGGVRVNDLAPRNRDVAMVFQNYALYPHMSVADNIGFPLRMRKVPMEQREQQVKRTAELLHIGNLLAKKPGQLSGGEQQRVALARSIIRQPKVFLMDEPLSNLDAKLRLYTRAELKRLRQQLKITTIFVTHDQAEALSMADKIAVMNEGTIIQYGGPGDIYNNPSTTFTASFVGSPPMNLIEATIVDGGQRLLADAGAFRYEFLPSHGELLRKSGASEVFLGIRPENLQLSSETFPKAVFEAEIYVVEPLGSSTLVDIQLGGVVYKAVIQGDFTAAIGDKTWVGFPGEKLHVFDRKSGTSIV